MNPEGRNNLHEYLDVLSRRRWTAAAFLLAVFISVSAAAFIMPPVYQATALVYVDPGVTSQYMFQQSQYPSDNTSYMETQIGILKSKGIALKVVRKLGLDRAAQEEGSGFVADLLGFFGIDYRLKKKDREKGAVRNLQAKLRVSAVKNSNLISVSYEDRDPVLAAGIVNEAVTYFVEQNLEMKVTPARDAMAWLNGKLAEIKSRMTASSTELQDFKRSKGLLVTGDKDSNISLHNLTEIGTKAISANVKRYEAETRYRQVLKYKDNREGLMSLPAVMRSNVIQGLKMKRGSLSTELADFSKKYRDSHPQIIRLRNETDALDQQINAETELIVAAMKNQYETALKEEKSIKDELERQKVAAMEYERHSTEFEIMRQDVEGSRNAYDAVFKKFQESNIMGNVSLSNVQVLDKADVPTSPSKPKKGMNMLLGLLLGVFSGIGAAFVVEFLDNTCKTPEDVEKYLGLPSLGFVPNNKALQDGNRKAGLVMTADPRSQLTESFRNIRSSILLSAGDVRPKVLQICSALSSEGKTTVALNLALVMAAAGEKVLLMDGDLRKPRIHRELGLKNSKGLSSVLSRQLDIASVIKETNAENLSCVTSGPLPPNPGELLGSASMKETLAVLREMFDRIIIDCPPSLGIADSYLLSPLTDGIVLVVRSGKTNKTLVYRAWKSIGATNGRITGVVLNDVSAESHGYYYGYYRKYYTYGGSGETGDGS